MQALPGLDPKKEIAVIKADLSKFYVVTVISNPCRYRRRYELYWRFKEMVESAGVKLVTVEMAFGDRDFMVTESNNPYHVQVRSIEELWHKENLINLGIQRISMLDSSAREVAWIDADIRPMDQPRRWFEETWHALQHYELVQMFEYIQNLDTDQNPIGQPAPSFMQGYIKGISFHPGVDQSLAYGPNWLGAPGGAWAANLAALKALGMLIDFCILGSGDWHMAQGLLGLLEPMQGERWSEAYSRRLHQWQERALKWIKKDVGLVRGGVMHDNHGPHKNRYYVPRKKILVEHNYDPAVDVKYDHQGLLQLETGDDRQISFRDALRAYFRSRLEDTPEYRP